jgi:tetratricopeptide (TPR) repeat protein
LWLLVGWLVLSAVNVNSRFAQSTVDYMTNEQVEKFLHRWCLAMERLQQPEAGEEKWQTTADAQVRQVLEAIQGNGTLPLMTNPLLLTILALIHRNGECLPNRHVKLYQLAVQTLTKDWQLGKKFADTSTMLLSQNEVVEFLAPLAYWIHGEKPSGLVTKAEVQERFHQYDSSFRIEPRIDSSSTDDYGENNFENIQIAGDIISLEEDIQIWKEIQLAASCGKLSSVVLPEVSCVDEAAFEQSGNLAGKLYEFHDIHLQSEFGQLDVQELLQKVCATTGVFVERASGIYGFINIAFQEYFAARYIADHELCDIVKIIRNHLYEPHWKEPIFLALVYYSLHFPRQFNKLLEELFKSLDTYEPPLQYGKIKIKNTASQEAVIIWSNLQYDSAHTDKLLEFPLKDLLFASQIIFEVEVASNFRNKVVQKLVLTYVCLDNDFEDQTVQQLLRRLRQIEVFYQKGEVIALLKQVAKYSILSEEMHAKALSALLYVACGLLGTELINCVTEIVNELTLSQFASLESLVAKLGEEISPALEAIRQNYYGDEDSQRILTFMTAVSYLRQDNYEKAIALLEEIISHQETAISSFAYWALGICYQHKEEYDKANDYYSLSKMAECADTHSLFTAYPLTSELLLNCQPIQEESTPEESINETSSLQNFSHINTDLTKLILSTINTPNTEDNYHNWQVQETLQEIEQLHSQQGNQVVLAAAYHRLGTLYRLQVEQGESSVENLMVAILAYQESITYDENSPQLLDTLNDLGTLYCMLSQIRPYSEGQFYLEQAIEFYLLAIDLNLVETHPETYSRVQNNLGIAYGNLARFTNPVENRQQAVLAYTEALRYRTPQIDPMEYAASQNNLATAYWHLAQYLQPVEHLQKAIASYTQAVAYYIPERELLNYGMIRHNIGMAYWSLAQYEQPAKNLLLAIDAYNEALKYRTPHNLPHARASTLNNLGIASWQLANELQTTTEEGQKLLILCINAYTEALNLAYSLEDVPLGFDIFATHNNLGLAHFQLATSHYSNGNKATRSQHLEAALDNHLQALNGLKQQHSAYQTTFAYLVNTIRAFHNELQIHGQNLALSKVPGELLAEILPRL